MTTSNYVDMDSFGSNLPENWEDIASEINDLLEAAGIPEYGELDADQRDTACIIWENYWRDRNYEA